MLTVVMLMLLAGIMGGVVNVTIRAEASDRKTWLWSIVAGIGAALLIPLFLRTVSSNLLTGVLSESPNMEDMLVFFGFCLLAAISSKSFIRSLSDKVLQEALTAKEAANRASEQVELLNAETSRAAALAEAVHDAAELGLTRAETVDSESSARFPLIDPGPTEDDPWLGQFGGKPEAGERRLSAKILPMTGRPEWCTIRLSVKSTNQSNPLQGPVQFYIHPTFSNYRPVVNTHDGEATLTIVAWVAFVVGALTDAGNVRLELDLSQHPEAREPWRSR
jgi:hypothetical protein